MAFRRHTLSGHCRSPTWEVGGTEKDNKVGMPSCMMFISRAHLRSLRCCWARIPTFFILCCDPQIYIPARSLKGASKSHSCLFPFDVRLCIYLETGSQQFRLSWILVDQAGHKLKDLPTSASIMLELDVYTTTSGQVFFFPLFSV